MRDYKAWLQAAVMGHGVIAEVEDKVSALFDHHFKVLSVCNATAGLSALCRLFEPGTIICPLFCSPAADAALLHAGHHCYFCDVDVHGCLDASHVKGLLKYVDKLRAVLAVNVFGAWCDLRALRSLADHLNVPLLLDAAQSFASLVLNPEYAKLADAIIISSGPGKWLAAADGGFILTQPTWHRQLVSLTQHQLRQAIQVPERPINHYYYNARMNPNTAQSLVKLLGNLKNLLAHSIAAQNELLRRLTEHSSFVVKHKRATVYEPVTLLLDAKRPGLQYPGFCLSNLPLPDRSELARKYNLPETLQQFKYRKVVELI